MNLLVLLTFRCWQWCAFGGLGEVILVLEYMFNILTFLIDIKIRFFRVGLSHTRFRLSRPMLEYSRFCRHKLYKDIITSEILFTDVGSVLFWLWSTTINNNQKIWVSYMK